jgi:hypothetical protein
VDGSSQSENDNDDRRRRLAKLLAGPFAWFDLPAVIVVFVLELVAGWLFHFVLVDRRRHRRRRRRRPVVRGPAEHLFLLLLLLLLYSRADLDSKAGLDPWCWIRILVVLFLQARLGWIRGGSLRRRTSTRVDAATSSSVYSD